MEQERRTELTEPRYEEVAEGIYNIQMPPAFNQYLVIGQEKALLVDTGMGIGSVKAVVDQITDLPIVLINTHGHPDHAGGNAEFAPALMNPADFDTFEQMASKEFRIGDVQRRPGGMENVKKLQPTGPYPVAVEDGAVIDLGGRKLSVLYTPGHTHGSLSVYDEQTGSLINGDNTMARMTTLAGWESSSVAVLADSLRRMQALHPTKVMGGHMPNINGPELIDKVLACCEDVLAGAEGAPHGKNETVREYVKDGVGIVYSTEHIH